MADFEITILCIERDFVRVVQEQSLFNSMLRV
jgi:hypothetical protein